MAIEDNRTIQALYLFLHARRGWLRPVFFGWLFTVVMVAIITPWLSYLFLWIQNDDMNCPQFGPEWGIDVRGSEFSCPFFVDRTLQSMIGELIVAVSATYGAAIALIAGLFELLRLWRGNRQN